MIYFKAIISLETKCGTHITCKLIHWTFVPLYVYGIFKQVGDISELEDSDLLLTETIFASVFLFIVLSRFFT